MSLNGLGMLAAGAVVLLMLATALPRLTPSGDASANAYWSPSSVPAEIRDEGRDSLATRNAYRREALGWKYSTPARSLVFRPCRNTEGAATDADADGLVDNLVPEDRWKKDWATHNPAVTDPDWATRTPAERLEALKQARQQMGMGSDFGRGNEPAAANCDQQRGVVSKGPYYGAN